MIDSKSIEPPKSVSAKSAGKAQGGIAGVIGEQCDDLEKKRVEQTDKMRLLLLKLGRMASAKTAKT